jgi:hypothetical protein
MDQSNLKLCANHTKGCTNKTPKKICFDCIVAGKTSNTIRDMGVAGVVADQIAKNTCGKCAYCQVYSGIPVQAGGVNTLACVSCIIQHSGFQSVNPTCIECKTQFPPVHLKQVRCSKCIDVYNAKKK